MYPFPALAQLLSEPRIAALVADAAPALLFDSDGRLRFANCAAIRAYGTASFIELSERTSELFSGLPDAAKQFAETLPLNGAPRRETIATKAGAETFRCERIALANGSAVMFSGEPRERAEGNALQALVPLLDSERAPTAAFDLEGKPLHLNRMAATIMGPAGTLRDFHPDASRAIAEAKDKGSADIPFGVLRLLLKKIDFGNGGVLIASFSQPERAAPAPMPTATPLRPLPEELTAEPAQASQEQQQKQPQEQSEAQPLKERSELPEVIVLGPPADAAPEQQNDAEVPEVIALGPPEAFDADAVPAGAIASEKPSPFAAIVEESISLVIGRPSWNAVTQAEVKAEAQPQTAGREDETESVPAPLMEDVPDVAEIVRGNAAAGPADAFVPEQPFAEFIAPDAEEIPAVAAVTAPADEDTNEQAERETPEDKAREDAAPQIPEPETVSDETSAAALPAMQSVQAAKPPRRAPTRFVWQSGADGRFTSVSADLADAVGDANAAQSGEDWSALGARAGIERLAAVIAAMQRRDTWSGVSVLWPVAGSAAARPVELAALPVFDRERNFAGFRGFGVFREPVPFIARTKPESGENTDATINEPFRAPGPEARDEPPAILPASPNVVSLRPIEPANEPARPALTTTEQSAFQEIGRVLGKQAPNERDQALQDLSRALGLEPPEERSDVTDEPMPAETPVAEIRAEPVVSLAPAPAADESAPRPRTDEDEDDDHDEDDDDDSGDDGDKKPQIPDAPSPEIEEPEEEDAPDTEEPPEDDDPKRDEPPEEDEPVQDDPPSDKPPIEAPRAELATEPAAPAAPLGAVAPAILQTPPEPDAPPEAAPAPRPAPKTLPPSERALLDRLPLGVAVHRGGRVLFANRTLLDWLGLGSMDELETEGGLARIFSGATLEESERNADTPRTLAARGPNGEPIPVETRLLSTPWYGDSALVYVLRRANAGFDERREAIERALRAAEASTREQQAILDTATDGVLLIDRDGKLHGMNKSAEALFGFDFAEVKDESFTMLFAPESQRAAVDYLDGLASNGVASVLNDGREVVGRERQGGLIPLFMTLGKVGDGEHKFCAVLRDITQWKRAEEELTGARRQAEIASSHKSDFLAKISHEMRTPLNAIIGFAEVMIEERFGPVGNERYREYLKDIHHSGGHLISLINDLLDLSKIEAGKLELNFTSVDINDIARQCMSIMQPQANRERIIIRSALAQALPPVVADARSIRQIVLNLLSNSVKFTRPGGQVILSTTLADNGEVCLRVRDTGIGMTADEVLAALEPFRQLATAGRSASRGTGLGLPLTKALVEANRAAFTIKSTPNAGTLIEVAFPSTRVLAG